MDVQDKVVLITGASGGIGLAAARRFAAAGARVAVAARSADKLAALAQELPGAFAVTADMRDPQAVQAMVAAAHAHFGRLDVLINNAGQGLHVPIEHVRPEDYRSVLELNVVGVLIAMQAAIPLMRAQGGGVIVNVSSGLSKRIVPGVGPYASTKYALNALTLTARQELAGDNIRVGLMIPGMTNTDFGRNSIRIPSARPGNYAAGDSAEHVADMLLEAVQTEAAETYANASRPAA
jgi:NAD(P)-dependent dehydrogenase (short-subunit alcohol dehydrogenase family)